MSVIGLMEQLTDDNSYQIIRKVHNKNGKPLTIHISYSKNEDKIKKAEEALYTFIAKEIL